MNIFHGTGIALVTPFNPDQTIDFKGLENLINHTIEGGVEYLVSLGTTGETATLSKEEKQSVFDFTVKIVNGRAPLVAGIGGNSTLEIVEYIKNFSSKGFDAILSVSPYYNKPTQEGIYQHYKAISEVSSLPIILYNVPGRTGSNMNAETTLKLAHDFDNIIGIKEASGDFEQCSKILKDKPENFFLTSGDDPITLPLIAMGAVGIISVIGNALPQLLSTMVRMCLDGKFIEAQPLHFSLLDITSLCFVEGNPAGIKAVLKQLDVCGDTLRLPLVNVSSGTFTRIAEELRKLY